MFLINYGIPGVLIIGFGLLLFYFLLQLFKGLIEKISTRLLDNFFKKKNKIKKGYSLKLVPIKRDANLSDIGLSYNNIISKSKEEIAAMPKKEFNKINLYSLNFNLSSCKTKNNLDFTRIDIILDNKKTITLFNRINNTIKSELEFTGNGSRSSFIDKIGVEHLTGIEENITFESFYKYIIKNSNFLNLKKFKICIIFPNDKKYISFNNKDIINFYKHNKINELCN